MEGDINLLRDPPGRTCSQLISQYLQLCDKMANQCEIPPALSRAQTYPHGLTLHHIMTIVSAVCTCATVLLCLFPFLRHMRHFVSPEQQKYIARIAILPAVFAIFHLFGVIFYDSSRYLEPFPGLFEAIAICSLFESYVTYVCPGVPHETAARFRRIATVGRYAEKRHGSLIVRMNFIFLYQLPFVTLVCLIATEVTSATQCELSEAYRSSQKIIRLITTASTIIALTQIITFHIFARQELRGMKAVRKLTAIKTLAVVVITMTVVFGFFKPAATQRWPHASYFDITVGVPNFLICVEMVLFAIGWLFLFGLSSVQSNTTPKGQVSALAALGQVLNISDVVLNTLVAFTAKVDEKVTEKSSNTVSAYVKNEDGGI